MSTQIGSLLIDIGANVARLQQDMDSAKRVVAGGMREVQAYADKARGALGAIGIGLSGTAVVSMVKQLIDSAAAMDDLAEKTGATVEELSKLEQVARIGGTSMEVVEQSLIRLAKALHSTDEESKGADKALKAIGLSVDELKGLDTAAAMQKVAAALADYKDGAGKTAVALDLLGKSGAQALPYLKDLAEAGALNATLTAEQASAAEKFQKEFGKVGTIAGTNARVFVVDLLPALARVGDALQGVARYGLLVGKALAVATHGAITLAQLPFAKSPGDVQRLLDEFKEVRAAGSEDVEKMLSAPLFSQQYAASRQGADGALGDLSGYTSKAGKAKGSAGSAEKARKAFEEATRAIYDYALAAAEADAEIQKLTNSYTDLIEPAAQTMRELQKFEEIAPALGLSADQIERIRDAFREKIDIEQYGKPLKDITEEMGKQKDLAHDLGLTFSSAFEDAVISGKKFSDVLKGLAQDIARIILRKTVTEPLGDAISGMLKGILPSFGGARAGGGSVSPGQYYVVGERGPEVLLPGTSGTVVPNGAMGGVVNNVSIVVNAENGRVQGDGPSAAELGRRIDAAVRGVLLSERRPGGLLVA